MTIPKGEVPVLAPLQPITPGVKPNYEKNIQSNSNVAPSQDSSQLNNSNTGSVVVAPVPTSHNYVFYTIAGIALLVIVIYLLWRSKIIQVASSKNKTLPVLFAIATVSTVLAFGLGSGLAKAQESSQLTNTNKGPVQRTIVEEGGNEDLATLPPTSSTGKPASTQVVYGLAAICFIIVAIGAASSLWSKPPKSISKIPASKLPPKLPKKALKK